MKKYKVVGMMSGTSLDGLDLAYCVFWKNNGKWKYKLLKAITIPYPEPLKKKLSCTGEGTAFSIVKANAEFGTYLGRMTNEFIQQNRLEVDLIASHGHTIFHRPELGITYQLGSGSHLLAETGIPVVSNFRETDVALGGQGAPLVPVGDLLLFNNYDACLNLGGFSNISFKDDRGIHAFDISPVNMAMNDLCRQVGLDFDDGGRKGRKGKVIDDLQQQLNALEYYRQPFPKSLGKEWYLEKFKPLLARFGNHNLEDLLRTVYEHVSFQIAGVLNDFRLENILVTGGGAFNNFLMERLESQTTGKIAIPSPDIVNYKEALIFAFLGVLRIRNEVNVLSAVTGAKHDSSGGAVHV
jgi:anhydro-N-acetylmuramic acid kinase